MLTPPPIFVGRARELDRLASAQGLVAVAVITGVAGVGKSTLARAHAARWPGPVAVVPLRPGASIALLSEDVHRQLGVARYDLAADDDEGLAQLWALLDAQGALLVLDELHAWDAERRTAVVRSALAGLARGRLLAVSRELVALGPEDADRLELRLESLDRAAAASLWQALIALYGPAHDFEAAWQRSRGNPFLLRQAHAGRGDARRPLDSLVDALSPAEHALAMLIAVSQSPLPSAVLATTDPAVVPALATRLVVELDGDGHYVLHELFRDQLLATGDVAAARRRLVAALSAAPDVVLRVQETARQLRALGDEPAIAALIERHAQALVRDGADGVLLHELDALTPEVRTPALERLRARVRCYGLGVRRAYQRLASVVDAGDAAPETRLCLASVATWAGELAQALALFDQLAADPACDAALHERIALGRAWAEATRGARTTIAPHGEHALRLYEACLAGRTSEAADLASELIARVPARPPAAWSRSMMPALCGIALAREGWFDEAERALGAVGPAERIEHAWARAVIAGERGERIAAVTALSTLLPVIDRGGLFVGAMWTRVVLIRLHLQLGRRTTAGTLASEARALARRHGSTAFDPAIAQAEREDLCAFADASGPASTPAARLRLQLCAALVAACDEHGSPPAPLEIPDRVDFALDHATLALAHAVAARRRGQAKRAQAELARATELAARCGADRDLVAQLFDQLCGRDLGRRAEPMQIDATRHELRIGAVCRSLASRVSLRGLLYAFAAAADQQLDRDAIARALWHTSYDPLRHDSSLKSSIRRLRSLLLGTGAAVEAVVDGYRLVLPPEATFVPPAPGAAARSLAG